MKRGQVPLLLMLIAGAITTITVYFKGLGLKTMLITLLAALVIFYFLGSIIVYILDSFDRKDVSEVSDEGEVIEKDAGEVITDKEAEPSAAEETGENG